MSYEGPGNAGDEMTAIMTVIALTPIDSLLPVGGAELSYLYARLEVLDQLDERVVWQRHGGHCSIAGEVEAAFGTQHLHLLKEENV